MSNRKGSSSYILSTTLQKAFQIVECIGERQPVGAPEIQRATGLTKGNVHRLLATLQHLDYVHRGADGYVLTFKMFALGNTVPTTRDIVQLARPYLDRIAGEFAVTAYLSVRTGLQMVNLDRARPNADISVSDDFAISYDLHCTASGRLLLASMDREEREAAYAEMGFAVMTEHTLTDPVALDPEVERARADGFAVERREHGPNINSVAAPIRDHTGRFTASLSAAAPAVILDEELIERLIPRLVNDAGEISALMGH